MRLLSGKQCFREIAPNTASSSLIRAAEASPACSGPPSSLRKVRWTSHSDLPPRGGPPTASNYHHRTGLSVDCGSEKRSPYLLDCLIRAVLAAKHAASQIRWLDLALKSGAASARRQPRTQSRPTSTLATNPRDLPSAARLRHRVCLIKKREKTRGRQAIIERRMHRSQSSVHEKRWLIERSFFARR